MLRFLVFDLMWIWPSLWEHLDIAALTVSLLWRAKCSLPIQRIRARRTQIWDFAELTPIFDELLVAGIDAWSVELACFLRQFFIIIFYHYLSSACNTVIYSECGHNSCTLVDVYWDWYIINVDIFGPYRSHFVDSHRGDGLPPSE